MRALVDYYEQHVKPATAQMIAERPPGHMYEVNLHADPESFLDWDRPLREQPHIAEKLERFGYAPTGRAAEATGEEIYSNIVSLAGGRRGHTEGIASRQLAQAGIPGTRYLDQFSRNPPNVTRLQLRVAQVQRLLREAPPADQQKLAEYLAIAEQDLKHAVTGTQTRNYVVYPGGEDLIEIARKYGIPLAMLTGSGGLAGLTQGAPPSSTPLGAMVKPKARAPAGRPPPAPQR